MLDLRVLRDTWTEEGARTVFAQIVTQCVKTIYPLAREIRPNPGDEGIDSFIGEIEGDIRVYQSKYFCDGVGNSQKRNIRESFKTCMESKHINKVVLWTLCIPIDLDVKEEKWWQKWKKTKTMEYGCQIELWTKTNFISFRAKPEIKPVFDLALKPPNDVTDYNQIFQSLGSNINQYPVKKLPDNSNLSNAIFVKKLEKAGVFKHLAARTAFYNFELLRTAISESGISNLEPCC